MHTFIEFIGHIKSELSNLTSDRNPSIEYGCNMVDFNLTQIRWDQVTKEEYPRVMNSFINYKNDFKNVLRDKFIKNGNTLENCGALLIALYKILAHEKILPQKYGISIEDQYEHRASEKIENFVGCFGGVKTLHITEVMDGMGDLIHFCNWFANYCNHNDKINTSVVISFSPSFNKENQIRAYIQQLPANHPLHNHPDLTLCKNNSAEDIITNKIFAPVIALQQIDTYNCIYSISTVPIRAAQILRLCKTGLSFCIINELGVTINEKVTNVPNLYELSMGIGKESKSKIDYMGLFFSELKPKENAEEAILHLSPLMREKLFGKGSAELTESALLNKAQQLKIICGQYQTDRDIKYVQGLLLEVTSDAEVVLFLTGTDNIDPVITRDLINTPAKPRVVCANLSKNDHDTLMQFVRVDSRHLYFCSGDNTFATSLQIGKLPIYVHKIKLNRDKKETINAFASYLLSLTQGDISLNAKEYIQELVTAIHSGVQYKSPSKAALDYFTNHIAPYLCREFDLLAQISPLFIDVENRTGNKFSLEVAPFIDPLLQSQRRRLITQRYDFAVRHFIDPYKIENNHNYQALKERSKITLPKI